MLFAVWAVVLIYPYWYFSTGWSAPNAIMSFCSQFNDTDLGWFKFVFGHGVLNAIALYGAIYPLAFPIVLAVSAIIRKSFWEGFSNAFSLFFVLLLYVVIAVGLFYSAIFLFSATIIGKIIAVILLLCGLFTIASGAFHTYTVIIVRD